MFFIGMVIDDIQKGYGAVVMEKVLTRARKEYLIHDAWNVSSQDEVKAPIEFIETLYQDNRYIRKKKVFSQSKRPPRNSSDPPIVMIHETRQGSPVISRLRSKQVPVNAVYFQAEDGWDQESLKIIRQGRNFYLNPKAMNALEKVFTSKRITALGEAGNATMLSGEIERLAVMTDLAGVFSEPSYVLLPPLFLCLWFCETIRQVKRY